MKLGWHKYCVTSESTNDVQLESEDFFQEE
jgi:hypothetical protein